MKRDAAAASVDTAPDRLPIRRAARSAAAATGMRARTPIRLAAAEVVLVVAYSPGAAPPTCLRRSSLRSSAAPWRISLRACVLIAGHGTAAAPPRRVSVGAAVVVSRRAPAAAARRVSFRSLVVVAGAAPIIGSRSAVLVDGRGRGGFRRERGRYAASNHAKVRCAG